MDELTELRTRVAELEQAIRLADMALVAMEGISLRYVVRGVGDHAVAALIARLVNDDANP